jgi:TRAP-type C4-dicarboxylate transport system permease small subunit
MTEHKVDDTPHLIATVDPEVKVEHHVEDWLSFGIFWTLAGVVFLQFFTRYVLNDSVAWTEEIARYLLIWITFIGAAISFRRGTHISVEALHHFVPEKLVRPLRFAIDITTVCFVVLLCWFSITITERMHIQTMTVIEWPMSIVYAGVGLGCFLMLYRAAQVFIANAKRRWAEDPAKQTLIVD